MLSEILLKELLSDLSLSVRDKLLCCLAKESLSPCKISEIRRLAISLGLRSAQKHNISASFSKAKPLTVLTEGGWELTKLGREHIVSICNSRNLTPVAPAISTLRQLLPKVEHAETRNFVEESIRAFELKLYRSAVVLSWVGAVSVLYKHVQSDANVLNSFNVEASKRDLKWKQAKTTDDLAKMKESEFLQVLNSISVIGQSVKNELEPCLKLRNGCGHPNSLEIGQQKVAAHIETLVQNVFLKF